MRTKKQAEHFTLTLTEREKTMLYEILSEYRDEKSYKVDSPYNVLAKNIMAQFDSVTRHGADGYDLRGIR